MNKSIVIATLLFISANSFAQTKKSMNAAAPVMADTTATPAKANEHKDKYKDLNLTDEQKGKIKELNKRNKAEKGKIENDATLTPEQKSAKLKEIKKEQSKSFKAILTPEQIEKFKASNNKSKDNE
jgi:Spy/CpxP family protein refolding chaperone